MNPTILNVHDQVHIDRIKTELQAAGISHLGLHRFTSTYLPRVIHVDEHIMAAVYGRNKEIEGMFGAVEGLLLATDKRVIFVDHRPGYTTMDEISYDDVVTGVNRSRAGFYASVTLFTKVNNYTLSFVKPKCAKQFTEYIEDRIINSKHAATPSSTHTVPAISNEGLDFLTTHELGVLSSIDRTGNVSGAAIYYTMYNGLLYFMTKSGTRKAASILGNQRVALTVVDAAKLQTVQLQGIVEAEADEHIKAKISGAIIKPRKYDSGSHLPPVVKLDGDNFIIFRIIPIKFSFNDYSKP